MTWGNLKPISFPRIGDFLESKQPLSGNPVDQEYSVSPFYGDTSEGTRELEKDFPCVLYKATPTFEVTDVSKSVEDLLGIGGDSIIACRGFFTEWLFDDDLPFIEAKLQNLKTSDYVSFAHRMLTGSKLPIWVAHSLRKDFHEGKLMLRGCLNPIRNDKRVFGLDQTLVTRFVHKLGNQFQLLNLVLGSLKKSLPETREADILFETLEKAADITREFADCHQLSSWWSEIKIIDLLKSAIDSQRAAFSARGVSLRERYEVNVEEANLSGDPFMLEAALTHILTGTLNAIHTGDLVSVTTWIENRLGRFPIAKVQIVDSRCETCKSVLNHKKEHDGLGFTLAERFIEMHGGLIRRARTGQNGNSVEIALPISFAKTVDTTMPYRNMSRPDY